MLILQDVTYTHPDWEVLFSGINFIVNPHQKIALTGNNGTGKSTLLKLMAGVLPISGGTVKTNSKPYYVPQIVGQYNNCTVAEALQVGDKIKARNDILGGQATEESFHLLDDDWTIEERCFEALDHWGLGIDLSQQMEALSGGQKGRVFMAGIRIHQPEIVLLDEPGNHLDAEGRALLYDYIRDTRNTLVVVSHDRALLNLLPITCELNEKDITTYGGNYDFYEEQKNIENQALLQGVQSREKALRKAKETEREALERQQKLDARGKKKQGKAGLPTILMNTFKDKAEKSTSKLKSVHAEKTGELTRELLQMRSSLPAIDKMKMDMDHSALHKGKVLVAAREISFSYHEGRSLWKNPLSFEIISGGRFAISGSNGSGKTTLIKLVIGTIEPRGGKITRTNFSSIYVDQDYLLIGDGYTVYQQAQEYNSGALQEHDIKIRLNRFLFGPEDWSKPCSALSGGEKMRLMLCMLTIGNRAPDIIFLDEPTNNLDMQNMKVLTDAINEYQGTLIVISHDSYFLQQIGVEQTITLNA